jgi:hypothetical protein
MDRALQVDASSVSLWKGGLILTLPIFEDLGANAKALNGQSSFAADVSNAPQRCPLRLSTIAAS